MTRLDEAAMMIDTDVAVAMDDGIVLRADVFRPPDPGLYPVLLSHGPYAKGLAFQTGYPDQWRSMVAAHPDVEAGSSNRYQNWEVVDPEKWVPDGYVCVRVDSRGTGRSPGTVDHFSPRETDDLVACIDWAGNQPWSNGKVGLAGVSYYGMNQWHAASRRPPHLAAICVWEGAADWYRDATHHGGILSTFWANWSDMQVKTVQHGLGERGPRTATTGDLVCGPETLSDQELADRRSKFGDEIRAHPNDDGYHRERSAAWDRIEVPLLTAGNWGGQGLHLRGNVEGFVRAAASEKWLELHGGDHWSEFYTDYGVSLQKRFFGWFLKGEDTGWEAQPRVQLQVRLADGTFVLRREQEWPLARTAWCRQYLDLDNRTLAPDPPTMPASVSYSADGDGVTFFGEPLAASTELTGPAVLTLFVSSSTVDADIFAVVRAFDASDREITFQGAIDPHTPVAQGWLRASHRKLDRALSAPYRPYHTHDEAQPLSPGEVVELNVEILPTSIVLPAGFRLAVTIRGRDYQYGDGSAAGRLSTFKNPLTGCGPFLHDDPIDRPEGVFGRAVVTLHQDPARLPLLLVPVVPASALSTTS